METKREVLRRVHQAIRLGGALFLAGAETTWQLSESFQRVLFERHAYYRAGHDTRRQPMIPLTESDLA